MYNYTYEGIQGYINASSEKELIMNSNKKEFKAFEWDSISNSKGIGLSTKIRMVEIQNKEIIPTTEWRIG